MVIKHSFESSNDETMKCLHLQIVRLGKLLNIPEPFQSFSEYHMEFDKVAKHHGNNHKLRLFKYYYDCVKAMCLHMETLPTPDFHWVRTDKVGIPSFIRRVLAKSKLNLDDVNHARFALTLFSTYELGKVNNPSADLKSLTSPLKSQWTRQTYLDFQQFLESENDIRKIAKVKKIEPVKDYVSLKGGPLGVGTTAWTKDLLALSTKPAISNSIHSIETKLGLVNESSSIANALEFVPKQEGLAFTNVTEVPLVSTQGIPDKGPKTRTISKGNYYLQRSLKPIHNYVMDILKSIPEDGTYRQDSSAKRVKEWTKSGLQPYCYDLTAATDRLPMDVQVLSLKHINLPLLKEWTSLMQNCRSFNEDSEEFFTFSVGQPMGLYSSWPTFTLTHHLIMRFAFSQCGVDHNNGYSIIGDDLAILNPRVAEVYKSLILGLGVEISTTKSVVPDKVSSGQSAEMAKRLFRNGDEISPLRPRDLVSLRLQTDGWIHLKDFALEMSRRWGPDITWRLISSKASDIHALQSIPLLTFVSKSCRYKAKTALESPFGGPRFHFFGRKIATSKSRMLDFKDGSLYAIPDPWSPFSNEWIGFARECVVDKILDNTVLKLSNVLSTFRILNGLDTNESVSTQFLSFDEFHTTLWYKLGINPFYQAIKALETEIDELVCNPFLFRTAPALEIVPKINSMSASVDLAHDWLSGKVKRDISDLKTKSRKATAKNLLDTLEYCKDPQLEIISLTSREFPEPTDFGETEPLFHNLLSRKNRYFPLRSGSLPADPS